MKIKKTVLSLSLIIISLCTKAQFLTSYIETKNFVDSIPYRLVNNKIIIECNVDEETCSFILDTGASCAITADLSKRINGKLHEKKFEISDQSGIRDSSTLITIDKIKIGTTSFNNVTCIIDNNKQIYDCLNIDGIIGSSLFHNAIIHITSKKIVICDQIDNLPVDIPSRIEMHKSSSQALPYIDIYISKGNSKARETVLFDTGMDGLYDMSIKNYRSFLPYKTFKPISRSMGSNTMGFWGIANFQESYRLIVPTFKISSSYLFDVKAQTTTNSTSRIGVDIIKYNDITLDFINSAFYIKPKKDSLYTPPKELPISLSFKNDKVIIGQIWDTKLLKKISIGDQLIEINNINYEKFDLCDLISHKINVQDKNEVILKKKNGDLINLILKAK